MTSIAKKHHVTRDVYDLACERMVKCYKQFDTVGVLFSGGKDSTIVLHVAIDVARALNKLPVEVAYFDEEAIPPDTNDYVRRTYQSQPINLKWLCVPIKHRNACSQSSPWWYPWAPEDEAIWTNPLPPEAITTLPGFQRVPHALTAGFVYPPNYGRVCTVMGVRTQESLNRYMAVASKTGHNAFLCGDHWKHVTRAYPIYDWAHEDVWMAPAKFGWDYNRAYDLMQMAGIPLHHQRCAPPFGEQPLERLWTYHVCWPFLWDKMCGRVPGAATAGRYARTALYGYGATEGVDKPAHLSWREFFVHKLEDYPVADRAKIAHSMMQLLDWHRDRTTDPLPDDQPHPHTGLCWSMVAKLAVRGDLKGRTVLRLKTNARLWVERQRQNASTSTS